MCAYVCTCVGLVASMYSCVRMCASLCVCSRLCAPVCVCVSICSSARVNLLTRINEILQKYKLDHLGDQLNLYLYGHNSINFVDNRDILISTLNYIKETRRFST